MLFRTSLYRTKVRNKPEGTELNQQHHRDFLVLMPLQQYQMASVITKAMPAR